MPYKQTLRKCHQILVWPEGQRLCPGELSSIQMGEMRTRVRTVTIWERKKKKKMDHFGDIAVEEPTSLYW